MVFKECCDRKDPFHIYKMNDKRGNPDLPSFIFKTSTENPWKLHSIRKKGKFPGGLGEAGID